MRNVVIEVMKKWILIIFVLLSVTISLFSQTAPESHFIVTLTKDNAGAIITRYRGPERIVIIPDTIQGMPVREIGERAFTGNTDIEGVMIPEGVIRINGSPVTDAHRPYIGAFSDCKRLYLITMPRTLRLIGYGTFANCTALRSIDIPEGVTEIQEYIFLRCENLDSVTLPSTLTKIGNNAFSHCISLTSVTLPAGLREIGQGAFSHSGLISFPDPWPRGLTTIGESMFSSSKMRTAIIPEGITNIDSGAFIYCNNLTSVTLPSTIRRIESSLNSNSLTTINIPESVRRIEFVGNIFYGSVNLTLSSQARLRQLGYSGNF